MSDDRAVSCPTCVVWRERAERAEAQADKLLRALTKLAGGPKPVEPSKKVTVHPPKPDAEQRAEAAISRETKARLAEGLRRERPDLTPEQVEREAEALIAAATAYGPM